MNTKNSEQNLEPVERIPAEQYEALENFLLYGDPENLTVEILQNEVTEEELATYKALHKKRFTFSGEGQKEINRITLKMRDAAQQAGKRLNPFKRW